MPLKTNTYLNFYDGETKWIIFLIKDNDLLKKHNGIWNSVSNSIKKNLTILKKVLKTKIRSYGHEATDFHSKKVNEAGSILVITFWNFTMF